MPVRVNARADRYLVADAPTHTPAASRAIEADLAATHPGSSVAASSDATETVATSSDTTSSDAAAPIAAPADSTTPHTAAPRWSEAPHQPPSARLETRTSSLYPAGPRLERPPLLCLSPLLLSSLHTLYMGTPLAPCGLLPGYDVRRRGDDRLG